MEKKKVWWGRSVVRCTSFFTGKQNFCGCIARTFPSYTEPSVFLVAVVRNSCKALETEGSRVFWVCAIFEIHDTCEDSCNSMQALTLQEVEPPRFPGNPQMKVLMLSVLRTNCLYPPGKIPGTHFCQSLNRPHGHNATGGIKSIKVFQCHHRESNLWPSGWQRSASTNCATASSAYTTTIVLIFHSKYSQEFEAFLINQRKFRGNIVTFEIFTTVNYKLCC